jgi:hypothetical protein
MKSSILYIFEIKNHIDKYNLGDFLVNIFLKVGDQ